ncbi:hypothetical protein ACWCXB_24295 [Streptomyces sp. NPDC001514]
MSEDVFEGDSARLDGVTQRAWELADEASALAADCRARMAAVYGWWGTEGASDDYADAMGPKVRKNNDDLFMILERIGQAMSLVNEGHFRARGVMKGTQGESLDEIDSALGASEDVVENGGRPKGGRP